MSKQRSDKAPSEEQIRARAFKIYAGRGYQEGNEEADWLQAEQELSQELSQVPEGDSLPLGEPELREPDGQTQTHRKSNSRAAGSH